MDVSDWLLCDFWTPIEAALLLSGINPEGTLYREESTCNPKEIFLGRVFFLDGTILDPKEPGLPAVLDAETLQYFERAQSAYDSMNERRLLLASNVVRIFNLIERSALSHKAAPNAYVEWAISKRITIPWSEPALPSTTIETPENRRKRLVARIQEEKSKGTKNFLQVVATEEKISSSRLKQLTSRTTSRLKKGRSGW